MKKYATWLLLAVAGMWVVKDPTGAAALAHTALNALSRAATALGSLASNLH
jgi:hypothetical protein